MKKSRLLTIITYAFLTFWALIVLFPFYWMVLTSVKDYGAYNAEYRSEERRVGKECRL